MANVDAPRDNNHIPALIGTSNADGVSTIPVYVDSATNRLLVSTAGSGSNAAASNTGSAVPAAADYLGVNIGGTLRGQTGVNPTGTVYAAQTDITSIGGTSVVVGNGTNAGALRVAIASDNTVLPAVGAGATGSAVPANAVYAGGIAKTSLPTAATDGNTTGVMVDKFGRQVVLPMAQRDLVLPMTQLTLTASTTETSLIAAVASTYLDLVSLVVVNTSATATQVDFRDSTGGTVRLTLYVPAGDMRGIVFSTPMPQAAVNTAWTAKCGTSVSSVIITGTYITNK